jgi:VWFA-related protein
LSWALIATTAMGALSFSQEPPQFRADVDLVAIACAVVGQAGEAVRGLSAGDFRVYDNGRRRLIDHVWVDDASPLTLGVIIDGSESQSSKLAEHRETALGILREIMRPGDRAFLLSIADEARLIAELDIHTAEHWERLAEGRGVPFGAPCTAASYASGSAKDAGCGSTRLWDAVHDAARLRMKPITGNKALLLLTDGFDSGSTRSWRQAGDEAQKADASMYVVQYRSDLGGTFPETLYRLLAELGGTWFGPPNGNYRRIASRIETDLRGRYILSFRPDKLGGTARHEVRIETADPSLTVRARGAYFWPPQ